MGSIWKAVTDFFKPKESMSTKVAPENEPKKDMNGNGDSDDSDADDEDFVPTAGNEDVGSEEISDDADEDVNEEAKTDKGKGRGKKRKRVKAKVKNGKRRRNVRDDDSDDSEDDADFTISESSKLEDEDVEATQTPEEIAAKEAEERAETDKLWAEFLKSVEEEKSKKKEKERTIEKIVDKVYDFAGEKVSVQEKVTVTVSNSNSSSSSDVSKNSVKNGVNDDHEFKKPFAPPQQDDAVPGPSSAMNGDSKKKNTPPNPPPRRRGGISILGNDPETIGLDELDKRGLSGLLKAFQSKSKRIGTLEKSKLDWESYKRQQGLEDELHHHNKSRDTYIDKQEFLQRADHRQFEIEKNMRATARSRRLAN